MIKYNNPEKRIYSLNCAAYIMYITSIKPQFIEDENSKGIFYCLFEECQEVDDAIKKYRTDDVYVNLHRFLNIFKDFKGEIYKQRQ